MTRLHAQHSQPHACRHACLPPSTALCGRTVWPHPRQRMCPHLCCQQVDVWCWLLLGHTVPRKHPHALRHPVAQHHLHRGSTHSPVEVSKQQQWQRSQDSAHAPSAMGHAQPGYAPQHSAVRRSADVSGAMPCPQPRPRLAFTLTMLLTARSFEVEQTATVMPLSIASSETHTKQEGGTHTLVWWRTNMTR